MTDEHVGPPKATMAQVAERAGTSVPTVSKVLSGKTDVSEAMRARVMRAIQELSYQRPTRLGSAGDDRRRAKVIDVVVGHIDGSWVSGVLEGVEEEASAHGIDLVLTVARPDGDWVGRLLRRPTLGAIIVLVDTTAAQFHVLTNGDVRVVVVDPRSRPPVNVASIGATNWNGGRTAAEHLLSLGHTRIGVIGGARNHLYSSARIDGFTTALLEAGISVPPPWLAFCDWDRDRSRRAARGMLIPTADRPTAIFACSDIMALGVYDAAGEAGLGIPHQLSVIGFDDLQESAWATPPMTTIQQPIFEMGAAAFRLLNQTRPTSSTPIRMEIETRLIDRRSASRMQVNHDG